MELKVGPDEWIESDVFEIAKVENDEGQGGILLSIVLSSEGEEDVTVTHRLATRQAVEEAIACMKSVADELWPVS